VPPRNRPMTIGDKIWVDKGNRAELQARARRPSISAADSAGLFLNLIGHQHRCAERIGTHQFRVSELSEATSTKGTPR